MKTTLYLFATCCALTVFSCKDEKKETVTYASTDNASVPVAQVAAAAATEGTIVKLAPDQVPDSVEMSFKTKYPKALTPVWVKYTPVEDDDMNMDSDYYYVQFMNNGADITSWYDNMGEWVKTSTRISGDSRLPDAVNQTLNTQYPGYKIESIDLENDKNMDMYKIKIYKGDEKAKVKILPNGEIFKRKGK
ncbi:MAG: PepSY-like domain-containing protein [Ferruginibacter sp.]